MGYKRRNLADVRATDIGLGAWCETPHFARAADPARWLRCSLVKYLRVFALLTPRHRAGLAAQARGSFHTRLLATRGQNSATGDILRRARRHQRPTSGSPGASGAVPVGSARRIGVVAAALLLSGIACSRNIGDSCSSSADCDPTRGTRTCDLSQPGGYCVVEGCDARSCPSNSVCVRVFPGAFLSKACSADTPCATDEICLGTEAPSGADAGGLDAGSGSGYCARLGLERRLCLQTCGGNGDCRGGYVCSAAGMTGTVALTLSAASAAQARFCEPAQ
jgi:hypothetical protein